MKSSLSTFNFAPPFTFISTPKSQALLFKSCKIHNLLSSNRRRVIKLYAMKQPNPVAESATNFRLHEPALNETVLEEVGERRRFNELVVPPLVRAGSGKLSLSDQAFFLLAFIACTTSVAFTGLVVAAVPTLCAMARAATSLSRLADTAREELPSTMAAIRLSGMEISDLTLELSDLSQEITDGVTKSAQAVQAAEAGIRKIGSLARQQTVSMIEERANLPAISLQQVVTGVARKTRRAFGQATKTFVNNTFGDESGSRNQDDNKSDKVEK